jgi:hypothetical protein
MSHMSIRLRVAAVSVALACAAVGLWGQGAASALAEDLPVGSLSLAPADAAFYSATLRGKEQYDLVMQSNAWKKLKNMPTVQMGMMFLQFQLADPESPVAKAKEMLDAPENQELVALLADMAGEEMFVYGSADYLDLIDLFQSINTNNQFGPIIAAMQGEDADGDAAAAQQERVLKVLAENIDSLVVPDTVFGFKVTKSDEAMSQLERLEKVLTEMIAEEPKLEGSLTRKKIGDTEYLSLILTGEMIPWEEIEDQLPEGEDRDKIVEHVKEMTLEIVIGLQDEYVIVSIGDNAEHLATLGEGDTLSGVDEMEKLSEHADERLTGIGYASEALMTRASSTKEDLDSLKDLAEQLLADAEVDEDLKERIKADVAELTEDMVVYIPEPGAIASIAFLNETGTESFTYNWGTNPMIDGGQVLSMLNHVGSDPLVACVARGKYSPDSYATLVKWLKKGHGYFEDFGLPQMEEEERDKYAAIWPVLVPLLERLDTITGTKFLPAMADGQSAFVLDAKMSSNNWIKSLPVTAEELPLIEPAIVCGVTDAKMLVEAMSEYRTLVNDTLDKLEEVSDGEAKTDFRLEAPEMRKFDAGDVYFYRLPEEAGVEKRLAPNGGLSESVAVLSISPRTTVRLLESTPMELDGPLAEAGEHPGFGACYVNVAGLLDALTPWIDLGIRVGVSQFEGSAQDSNRVAQKEAEEGEEEKPAEESPEADAPADDAGPVIGDPANDTPTVRQIISQVHDAIDVFKVFQSYQSFSYLDDDIQVTHGQWQMTDTE